MKPNPLDSDVLAAFLDRATKLHGEGQFQEAARLYAHVHYCNPDVLAAPYFLGLMELEAGWLEAALERFRYVIRCDPRSYEGQFALAYTFQELGQWQQAADAYRRALDINPKSASAALALVNALEVTGKLDEAVGRYRALAMAPDLRLRGLIGVARVKPDLITDSELEDMRAAAGSPDTPQGLRIGLLFAIGPVLESRHRFDEAFAAFDEGNRQRREGLLHAIDDVSDAFFAPPTARVRQADPAVVSAGHRDRVERAKNLFTSEFLARHAEKGHDSAAPIFVVGMPRSGSTLLEQILSSHQKVQGLGESPALWRTISSKFPTLESGEAEADPEHFRRLGQDYLARQKASGWRHTPRFVDKMLGNYLNIGVIHLMFPNAVILHSVRDPIETCLACFRVLFRSGNETTYDLTDIGEHYVRYREMMDHWRQVLPGRVIDVTHEELVAEPDRVTHWLIEDACNLKWDDACLRSHLTKRPVRTASVAQVRQPIFRRAVERWRRYEKHLAPLFVALGPYAPPPTSGGQT